MKFIGFGVLVVLFVLASGCIEGLTPSAATSTTQPSIVCNRPYIRVGGDCCLDRDGNGVCDRDETSMTEPSMTPTTAVTPTTAAMQPSPDAMCNTDADCGEPEVMVVCSEDDVVKLTVTYRCVRPGMSSADCIARARSEIVDTCEADEICYFGVCVDEDVADDYETTTTMAPETTTTTVPGASTTSTSSTTTTTGGGGIMEETTTTTLFSLPCAALPAWTPSQCSIRSCSGFNTCVYVPSANPLLPGSCTCKSLMLTTTTLMPVLPCSGFPAFTPSSCTGRTCLSGTCVYVPSANPLIPGSCACKATTTTLGMAPMTVMPTVTLPGGLFTTTTTTLGYAPMTVMTLPGGGLFKTTTTTTLGMAPMTLQPVMTTIPMIQPTLYIPRY